MKKFLLLLFIFIAISCKPTKYVQVLYTEGLDTEVINRYHIFENDTVRITYDFTYDKGVINFTVLNKLNRSIFIDWSKSSYINNTTKIQYGYTGSDVEKTKFLFPFFYITAIDPVTKKKYSKKANFKENLHIQPNSEFTGIGFYIHPDGIVPIEGEFSYQETINEYPNKKKVTIFEENFDKENSPIHFSNTFTFYFSESFREEFSITNKFYVNKVKEMVKNHFKINSYDKNKKVKSGSFILTSGLPSSFYIEIDKNQSIEGGGKK